jgi:hypothetical protein
MGAVKMEKIFYVSLLVLTITIPQEVAGMNRTIQRGISLAQKIGLTGVRRSFQSGLPQYTTSGTSGKHRYYEQSKSFPGSYALPFVAMGTAIGMHEVDACEEPTEKYYDFKEAKEKFLRSLLDKEDVSSELFQRAHDILTKNGFKYCQNGWFEITAPKIDKPAYLLIRKGNRLSVATRYYRDSEKIDRMYFCLVLPESMLYENESVFLCGIGHELGHINDHLFGRGTGSIIPLLNQRFEKQADIYAVEFSGSTQGIVEDYKEDIIMEQEYDRLRAERLKERTFGRCGWPILFTAAAYFGSPLVAVLPFAIVAAHTLFSSTHPGFQERTDHVQAYARDNGWEERKMDNGDTYYVRPENKTGDTSTEGNKK